MRSGRTICAAVGRTRSCPVRPARRPACPPRSAWPFPCPSACQGRATAGGHSTACAPRWGRNRAACRACLPDHAAPSCLAWTGAPAGACRTCSHSPSTIQNRPTTGPWSHCGTPPSFANRARSAAQGRRRPVDRSGGMSTCTRPRRDEGMSVFGEVRRPAIEHGTRGDTGWAAAAGPCCPPPNGAAPAPRDLYAAVGVCRHAVQAPRPAWIAGADAAAGRSCRARGAEAVQPPQRRRR